MRHINKREYAFKKWCFWHILPVGIENAVDARFISDMLGLPQQRTAEPVRNLAKSLNKDGFAVCSADRKGGRRGGGFFRARNRDEIDLYIETLEIRILGTQKRIEMMQKIKNNWRDLPAACYNSPIKGD